MTAEASQREKSGIPKNPGRADLGMRATLLFPSREIVEIMAEHYPVAYERYRLGRMESSERLQVWDACCAIHDARFEIEELCS